MGYMRNEIPCGIRFKVLERDSFTCQYCGMSAPDVVLHVDHIKPVSKGGTNDMDNLITACAACNLGKSTMSLRDDYEEGRQAVKERLNNSDRLNIVVASLEFKWCPQYRQLLEE